MFEGSTQCGRRVDAHKPLLGRSFTAVVVYELFNGKCACKALALILGGTGENFMVLPEGGIVTFQQLPQAGATFRKTRLRYFWCHNGLSVSAFRVVRSGVGPAVLGLGLGPAPQARSDEAAAFQAHADFSPARSILSFWAAKPQESRY